MKKNNNGILEWAFIYAIIHSIPANVCASVYAQMYFSYHCVLISHFLYFVIRTEYSLRALFFSPSCSFSCCRLSKQSSYKSEHQNQPVHLSVLQVQIRRRFWKCKLICESTKHYKSPRLLADVSEPHFPVFFSIFSIFFHSYLNSIS